MNPDRCAGSRASHPTSPAHYDPIQSALARSSNPSSNTNAPTRTGADDLKRDDAAHTGRSDRLGRFQRWARLSLNPRVPLVSALRSGAARYRWPSNLSAAQAEAVELDRDLAWVGLTVSVCVLEGDVDCLVDGERFYWCPVGGVDSAQVLGRNVVDSEGRVGDKDEDVTV
jgi:hypothetical protein